MHYSEGTSPQSARGSAVDLRSIWNSRVVRLLAVSLIACMCFSIPSQESTAGSGRARPVYQKYRTYDGTNNAGPGNLGSTFEPLLRMAPADYPGDGSGGEMMGSADRENPRTISNVICAQGNTSIPNPRGLSDWVWAWGQFLDHDIGLTETHTDNGTPSIEIEDPLDILGPFPIPFTRSNYHFSSGTERNPRQQINEITAYIDASNVYGSDRARARALRSFYKGRLKVSDGNLLPFNESGQPNAGGDSASFFLAGDVRANENIVLSSLHTLFMREHNRLANQIARMYPKVSDEYIYQLARKIVGAEMQIITYEEFLPALMGDEAPTFEECGWNYRANPSIANEFSGALYRFGHSLLSPNLLLRQQGRDVGEIALRNAFFNPRVLIRSPLHVDRLLAGLAYQRCQDVDPFVVDDVRNFLFGPPGAGGFDLASLNIQRGRDHGLADYNTVRESYGLPRVTEFSEITSDGDLQDALLLMYGTVDNIDLWVGGLAEDHLPGSSVGPLLAAALRDQFIRLLEGDRYSFLHDPDLQSYRVQTVIDLQNVTLADVIRRNTTVSEIPDNPFFVGQGETTDMTVTYNKEFHRVMINGNCGNNSLSLTQSSRGVRIQALGNSLINGRKAIFIRTKRNPNLTVDLSGGIDRLIIVNGKWNHVLTTFLPQKGYFYLGKRAKVSRLYTDLRPRRLAR